MPQCAAPNCTRSYRKGFRLFRFPTEPTRRNKWAANCRRKDWLPSPSSKLCEIHFDQSQFENNRQDGRKLLCWYAVPTIFDIPDVPKPSSQKGPLTKATPTRKRKRPKPIKVDPTTVFIEHSYVNYEINHQAEPSPKDHTSPESHTEPTRQPSVNALNEKEKPSNKPQRKIEVNHAYDNEENFLAKEPILSKKSRILRYTKPSAIVPQMPSNSSALHASSVSVKELGSVCNSKITKLKKEINSLKRQLRIKERELSVLMLTNHPVRTQSELPKRSARRTAAENVPKTKRKIF